MRIAFIGQKGIPLIKDGGGVERHVEELSTRLAKRGHEIFVYVRPRFKISGEKKFEEVNLIIIPSIPTKNLDTITHTFLATIHVLFKKADVIHYHGVGPATLAWIPRLLKRKTKIIATFHSQDKYHQKWGWFARIYLSFGEWAACRFPNQTIAVSHSIKKYCDDKFKNCNCVYIPNGVEPQKIAKDDKLKKWNLEKGKYLMTAARLIRHKGIHHLISAYHKLSEESPKLEFPPKLVIAGAPSFSKDYREYLTKLAAGCSDIIFTGFQSGETLAQLFAHAYLYVHPSESEGLSITILEAMSYGKCVVMSDIPENLEMIDHSGVAFKTADAKDLKEKLISLINHPEIVKERSAKAIDFIKKYYNWEKIVEKTEEVYKK